MGGGLTDPLYLCYVHKPHFSQNALLGKKFNLCYCIKSWSTVGNIGDRQHSPSNLQSSQVILEKAIANFKNIHEKLLALDKKQIIWSNDGSGTVRV